MFWHFWIAYFIEKSLTFLWKLYHISHWFIIVFKSLFPMALIPSSSEKARFSRFYGITHTRISSNGDLVILLHLIFRVGQPIIKVIVQTRLWLPIQKSVIFVSPRIRLCMFFGKRQKYWIISWHILFNSDCTSNFLSLFFARVLFPRDSLLIYEVAIFRSDRILHPGANENGILSPSGVPVDSPSNASSSLDHNELRLETEDIGRHAMNGNDNSNIRLLLRPQGPSRQPTLEEETALLSPPSHLYTGGSLESTLRLITTAAAAASSSTTTTTNNGAGGTGGRNPPLCRMRRVTSGNYEFFTLWVGWGEGQESVLVVLLS